MVATADPVSLPKLSRKTPNSGRLPAIKSDDLDQIADLVCSGLSLTDALSITNPLWTLSHWNTTIEKDTILARHYAQKCALLKLGMVKSIAGTTRANLPVGTCWILERRFPNEYAQPKAGGSGNVTFNGPVQINSTRKAVKSLLRKVTMPPKELPEA